MRSAADQPKRGYGLNQRQLGSRGEALAAAELERRGWTIVDRNYRFGHKEIDLVARRGEVVAFVEVKSRSGGGCGHPLEAVTPLKQREIRAVARDWMSRFGRPGDRYRFDAVAVLARRDGRSIIDHVEDAWGV